jgi:hypothetical protein
LINPKSDALCAEVVEVEERAVWRVRAGKGATCACAAGVPKLGRAVVDGDPGGSASAAQGPQREPLKKRADDPFVNLSCHAALLGGTQDRHGTSVVQPYCRRGLGPDIGDA